MKDLYGNERGETMVPELNGAFDFHRGRYEFALSKILGGKVLDVGCGIGYGSKVLLGRCSEYIGFDYHPSRKLRADAEFADSRCIFLTHNANDKFPFKDNSFDNAVCFEAIEHIDRDYFAISEIYRILKTNGIFIASTPINRGLGKGHYHIREYLVDEFKRLIESKFGKVEYYGQPYGSQFFLNDFSHIYILCVARKEP